MAIEKTALRVTELDFFSIRENLKNFLRSQDEFTDYDFEGSGMSVLLDLLAYNTHYMGYYLNMVGNEMFLDTAQIRNSVLSHAKLIGYVPNSNQGAIAKLDIKVTPSNSEEQNDSVIVLERYTKLLGTDIDGVNYPFVTLNANTATKSDGVFSFSNVSIKQGQVITRQFMMDPSNERRSFVIPSANVDISTIRVAVQESGSNVDTTVYTANQNIVDIDGNSTVYFLEENEDLTYTIQFGDNTIGRRPKDGNIVLVTYLDNVGSVANNISKFVFVDPVANKYSDNVRITSTNSYGGLNKESIEQVRFRAPYAWSAQHRAVNYHDYESIIPKLFNNIEAASVWGGEDNDPVIYGQVFISIKTSGNYQLTNYEKEHIKKTLTTERNMMTVTPVIVDPDYVYLGVDAQVTYDSTLTSLTAGEIEQRVRIAIDEFSATELNKFGSTFNKAKLQRAIEAADRSITSSEISISIQKQIRMDLIRPKTYSIPFNMKLKRGNIDNLISTYPTLELRDANGIVRNATIEEVPEIDTGVASASILSSGRNYLEAPTVTITGDGTGARAIAKIAAGRVISIEITNPGQGYSYAIATITSQSGEGASASLNLERNIGTLRTVYYTSQGEKVVLRNNVGSVNYQTGMFTLNSLRVFAVEDNEFYPDDTMILSTVAGSETIYPLRNRILTIDVNTPRSVKVEAIAR